MKRKKRSISDKEPKLIGLTRNQDALLTHWLVDDFMDEKAKTLCGRSIFKNRFYPLLWTNDSPRLLTCRLCRALRSDRASRKESK